jgi:hypothetical protein
VPIDAGGLHYAVGPVVAVVVLGLLALFLRWAFGPGHGHTSRSQPADDGLLTRIATLSRRESALALRAVLSDAGIRSTIRYPAPDRAVILVFPEDADRARALAISFNGPEQN